MIKPFRKCCVDSKDCTAVKNYRTEIMAQAEPGKIPDLNGTDEYSKWPCTISRTISRNSCLAGNTRSNAGPGAAYHGFGEDVGIGCSLLDEDDPAHIGPTSRLTACAQDDRARRKTLPTSPLATLVLDLPKPLVSTPP